MLVEKKGRLVGFLNCPLGSSQGYRDLGVLSGNGWLGTVDLNLCLCGLVMLIVRPRDALSLLFGRRNSLTFINTPNIYKRRLISR
jgi:hypothetical protein